MFFKKNKMTKGFTLIELLVVIAIIGILGAIVFAPFQTARRKGRDAQRVIEMKNLVSTIALYADSHNGSYPENLAQLQSEMSDTLPPNANCGAAIGSCSQYIGIGPVNYAAAAPSFSAPIDPFKYNYTAYYDSTLNRVVGFHLYTHLETANGAIVGGAKCQGSSTDPSRTISCVISPNILDAKGTIPEPDDGASAGNWAFTTASRGTNDADSVCATNVIYCILDYHQ